MLSCSAAADALPASKSSRALLSISTCSRRNGTAWPGNGGLGTRRSLIALTSASIPSPRSAETVTKLPVRRPVASATQAAGRSDLLATTSASRGRLDQLPVDRPQALGAIEDQEHQVGRAKFLSGPFNTKVFDRVARCAQTRRIGKLDGPASKAPFQSRRHRASCLAPRRRSRGESRKAH